MKHTLLVLTIAFTLFHSASAQAPAQQTRPDPKTITFSGDRFKPLTWNEMTPAQRTPSAIGVATNFPAATIVG